MSQSAYSRNYKTPFDDRDDWVLLGAVTGAMGIKGALRVKLFTEDLQAIDQYGKICVVGSECSNQELTQAVLQSVDRYEAKYLHPVKGGAAVQLSGVRTRNEAETFRGKRFYIERERLPELEDDSFYYEDLEGLKCFDMAGDQMGHVIAVHNFGAGDIIEVALDAEDGKAKMYPFRDEFVPKVDVENNYLVIDRVALGEVDNDQEDS